MKIVHSDTVDFGDLFPDHRQEVSKDLSSTKLLLTGDDSSPDNYALMEVDSRAVHGSPRHRHNFEQFRFALDGSVNYAPDLSIPEGGLGYFPEGTFYGPFSVDVGIRYLSLQFGGPCGEGFLAYTNWKVGYDRLLSKGSFVNGHFEYLDEDGKQHNKDGFEAIWSEIRGRPIKYPGSRYQRPIVMVPDSFDWIEVPGAPGVSVRELGVFNERHTAARIVRLDGGARLRLAESNQTRLFYVLGGSGTIDDNSIAAESAISLDRHESAQIAADSELTVLSFLLPEVVERAQVRPVSTDLVAVV